MRISPQVPQGIVVLPAAVESSFRPVVVNRAGVRSDPVAYDPLAREVQEDPYPYYRRLLADYPLYHNAERDIWALSRYEDLRGALKDWQTFSSGDGVNLEPGFTETIGPEILNMDPPRHDQLRRLVGHHFSNSTVRAYEPMVRSFAHELVDGLRADGGGDFAGDFSQRLPVLVICRLMGIPLSDEATVRQLAHDMLLALSGSDEFDDVSAAAADELRGYLGELVAARRRSPADDVISSLANGEIDGEPIGSDEVFGMCLIIYLAGNTTTSSLVSNGLYLLAQHPEQQARLAASPGAIPDAIEELLRYESPVQWTSRTTTTDVEMYGEVVPAGSRVMMLLGAAHRDPRAFDDPDTFDVFRLPGRHLGFGDGVHRCVGAPLARLEGRVALEVIFERVPKFRLTGAVERLYISTERGLARLPLAV